MDRDRELQRISAWVDANRLPVYDVRVNREIVSSVTVDDGLESIAAQLIDIIDDDFEAERRRRQYRIVGVADDGQQHVCPLVIYRRPESAVNEQLVNSLTRQNIELHETLLKRDEAMFSRQNKTIELISESLHRALGELSRGRERQEEFYTRLETLRTEQLERDIIKERHEKNQELLERGVDTVLPLVMAGAAKAFGGAAKPMLQEPTLVQIAKGMNEGQLDAIRGIIGDPLGEEVERFLCTTAIEGRGDVDRFRALLGQIPQEKLMQCVSTLNMGQQAAIREIISL